MNKTTVILQCNTEVIEDYMYIVNPFKEIIGISYYNGSNSSLTCSLEAIYIYDAWGNHQVYKSTGLIDDNPYSIGNINPLRYKGYYYDKETNLYYLMTRYYDPSIGQFISPDDYTYLDINKVSGYHLYAYCNNNPVMNEDPDGHMPDWAKWTIGGVNCWLRPDVLALGSRGSRVIEVVSRAQTIFDQTLKTESMKAINAGLQGIAVDWFLGE